MLGVGEPKEAPVARLRTVGEGSCDTGQGGTPGAAHARPGGPGMLRILSSEKWGIPERF